MKTYNLKSVLRRGSMLVAAFIVAGAAILPAASVSADELNPLTDRSLSLSSSSPGWDYKDGSGNTTYAVPNSGANGKQTGNTFAFKVSSDTTGAPADYIKSITFQYCTKSAGLCYGPGNNDYSTTRETNADSEADQKSDLEIVAASPSEVDTFASYVDSATGNVTAIPDATTTGKNFVVYFNNAGTWEQSTGWSMAASKVQDGTIAAGTNTDKNNFITLTNSTGEGFTAGQEVKIVFFATNSNYITNPGQGEFFVKINTYNSDTTRDNTTLVDGGVTVANVMNQSIQITTKVLETMQFSVGTVDPYTLALGADGPYETATGKTGTYGTCDPIVRGMDAAEPSNTLQLGDQDAESSLNVDTTYSTHSYWRLSSNSSAGATVYYAGVTLSNTVGDKIDAIGSTAQAPHKGTEQFGLAIAAGSGTNTTNSEGDEFSTNGSYAVDYGVERTTGMYYENAADNATAGIHADTSALASTGWHTPRLSPLIPDANYDAGAGYMNDDYASANSSTVTTEFAFDDNSNQIPVAIASEDAQVVDCVTAKMRYIANIAATTPAGIYTTKINYIAAPQY